MGIYARSSLVIRAAGLLFWLVVIGIFLFLPRLMEYFQDNNVINVMTWAELIDDEMIQEFERETGIRVNVSYFESNEQLYAKIVSGGARGYDLIMPSDYLVETLRVRGYLKPLDRSQLLMYDRLDPRLLNNFYDPDGEYALPYFWQIYGLGVDTTYFKNRPVASWDLIYKKKVAPERIVVLDTARENILLAAVYLFGWTNSLSSPQIERIKRLLIRQKEWVEAYTEMRADFLLTSKVCPVILSTTALMWKLIGHDSELAFLEPREGTFAVIDNMVLPKDTHKDALVYQFINYLYRPEIIEHHFNTYRFFPATVDLIALLEKYHADPAIIYAHTQRVDRLHYFKNIVPENIINDIWITLKA